jgi:hypothetical protein
LAPISQAGLRESARRRLSDRARLERPAGSRSASPRCNWVSTPLDLPREPVFSSPVIGDALASHLAESHGPEVIVVCPARSGAGQTAC